MVAYATIQIEEGHPGQRIIVFPQDERLDQALRLGQVLRVAFGAEVPDASGAEAPDAFGAEAWELGPASSEVVVWAQRPASSEVVVWGLKQRHARPEFRV